MNDIFEVVKRSKLTVQVEYLPTIDSYKITVMDKRYGTDVILDGLMLDNKPEFREQALEHCLKQFIARRR